MSELLKNFYLAYAAWLDDGTQDETVFSKANGLCSNLRWYCDYVETSDAEWFCVKGELVDQFIDAGLNKTYPFDLDGFAYEKSGQQYKCHLKPRRIQWVRDQVAKIKEEASS
jgi:hypothetical protein